MSFMKRIKEDYRRDNSGYGSKCVVKSSDLNELIRSFEQLDSMNRIKNESFSYQSETKQLNDILVAFNMFICNKTRATRDIRH